MSVTAACADFTVGLTAAAVPEAALEWAQWGMLDGTGVALAGAATDIGAIVAGYLELTGGNPQARVLGLGIATSAPEAAWAGGTLCHALDFDDAGGFGHPTAVLLPVIYALAGIARPSGTEALAAYVAGFEVGTRLGECDIFGAIDKTSWYLGWHPTGTFGTIAAACTAAKLLKLTRVETAHALGIAASEASGINRNFGTMTKPLHAGLAARNGVVAAVLAQRGFTAARDALGGVGGFLHAFKGAGDYTEQTVCAGLGETFALSRGLAIKWYPGGWSTHRQTAGVIDLMRRHALIADDIEGIEVALEAVPTLRLDPASGVEGKFSIAYNVALAALKGWPGIADYTAERLREPALASMMERVRHRGDPADGAVHVAILTKDGRRFETGVEHAPNDPAFGLQRERTLAKFRECAAYSLPPQAIAVVEEELLNLRRIADLSRLMSAMCPGSEGPRAAAQPHART